MLWHTIGHQKCFFQQLKLGQIDYIIIETLQAKEFCQANPQLSYVKIGTAVEGIGIALAKDSPLLPEINQALQALEQKGILKQLSEKWAL